MHVSGIQIGPLIAITTAFEFISAQSPLSMKGLIIGVSFAVRGLFQFINSTIIIPFSLPYPWGSGKMSESPPVTDCGFVYLQFTCVVGLIGLILLSVAAKKYKYRRSLDEGLRDCFLSMMWKRYMIATLQKHTWKVLMKIDLEKS